MLGDPAGSGPTPLSGIQSEADLHCHLPVRNLVVLEVATHLGDLKPLHISDRLASSRDRIVHCVFDAVWRGTDQLNLFVDVVTHKRIKPLHVASGEHIPRSKGASLDISRHQSPLNLRAVANPS